MRINRDKENRKLTLSQEVYIKKVLDKFKMQDAKSMGTPLVGHFKLSKEQCPRMQEEVKIMSKVPYSSIVGILMYVMACTRPYIVHVVGVLSRFMNDAGKEN